MKQEPESNKYKDLPEVDPVFRDFDPDCCPYCGTRIEIGCQHYLAILCDDSDGFDTTIPLYGLSDNQAGETLYRSFEAYFETLSKTISAAFTKGSAALRDLSLRVRDFPANERECVETALGLVEDKKLPEDYTDVGDLLRGEMGQELKRLFTAIHLNCAGEPACSNYEIAHSPGLIWTGTNYWANDPAKYLKSATKACEIATSRVAGIAA